MTAFHLKLLAGFCMIADHAAVALLEAPLAAAGFRMLETMLYGTPLFGQAMLYTALRLVGRLAFPIYAFQLAEGTRHTRSARRYLLRLFVFALLSELPFDLALNGGHVTWEVQNIYWTLLLGAGAIFLYQRSEQAGYWKWLWPAGAALLAEGLRTDYGWYGVLIIFLFFLTHGDKQRRTGWLMLPLALQTTAPLALLPINRYTGAQGRKARWAFYTLYPAHLLALYAIGRLLLTIP